MTNLNIWNALGKTDPAHTKQFNRAGGFKGTAVKPMWVLKRLTEEFGPVGVGWGTGKPDFQLVHSPEGEVLVYCTVSVWHTSRDNVSWGVGGDKAISRNKNGLFHDDEAFKKAFTDATLNGFKALGVAADIHMGLFDDDKYVSQAREAFSEPDPSLRLALDGIAACDTQRALKDWWDRNNAGIPERHLDRVVEAVERRREAIRQMDRVAA